MNIIPKAKVELENTDVKDNPISSDMQNKLILGGVALGTHLVAEFIVTSWEQKLYEDMVNPGTESDYVLAPLGPNQARAEISRKKIMPIILETVGAGLIIGGTYYMKSKKSVSPMVTNIAFGLALGLLTNAGTNAIEVYNISSNYSAEWELAGKNADKDDE